MPIRTNPEMLHEPLHLSRLEKFVFGAAGLAIVISIGVIGFYRFQFGSLGLSNEQKQWAEFGEFVGGTIGPIIGLVTIFALIATLMLQRQQLLDSSKLLLQQSRLAGVQSFEQTLFSWLGTYRDLLANAREMAVPATLVRSTAFVDIAGASALQYWWESKFNKHDAWQSVYGELDNASRPIWDNQPHFDQLNDLCAKQAKRKLLEVWDKEIYQEHEPQLDGLFRTLYRLIDWIDRQSNERISPPKRFFYVALVRAQLSKSELNYLFLNALTPRGHKFKRFVEKYALFDNLPVERDPVLLIFKNDKSYEHTAYSSDEARGALGLSNDSNDMSL